MPRSKKMVGLTAANPRRMVARALALLVCAMCVWAASATAVGAGSLRAQKTDEPDKRPKARILHWAPPNVDAALRSRISSPPCVLADALKEAGARAEDLITNLQNFTATEDLEYEARAVTGGLRDSSIGTFDYVVVLDQGPQGISLQESRNPESGSRLFPASMRDVGLPSLALIFLADMQGDYEMSCEGTAAWNGRPAWVVRFQQRSDKPGRAAAFHDKGAVYPVKLKGRAWIATDSGEVMHLETSMMGSISSLHIREWYLSIDYAPVKFRTQNVSIWLPRGVDAYCEYDEYRTIVYHTFSNFMLFSVRTEQEGSKPQNP